MGANLVKRAHLGILLVLVLVPAAVAAVVLTLHAGIEHGGWSWWVFGLTAAGALVFLGSAARGRGAVAGIAVLAGAAALSGWTVWRAPTTGGMARFLGEGGPSELVAASWLVVVLVVGLAVGAALRRAEITGTSARTWCVLLAVAVLVAGVAGAGVVLGGRGLAALREDVLRSGGVEHTVDASADPGTTPRRGAVTGPATWRTVWQRESELRTVVGTPTAPLVVSATGVGDQSGVEVHDNRTGAERWHFHSTLFGIDDAVAVSPSTDRVLVVIGAAAVVLDLDSGTEVARFALPEPTAGPTLGATRYQLIGPRPRSPELVDERPQVEIVGDVAYVAVTGHPGPTDVLAVSLVSGSVTTLATGVPEYCRFRALRHSEYVVDYDYETWLLRDGIGCGTPTLTRYFGGRRQVETPVGRGCEPHGCELPDAYATTRQVVVQTGTELLAFDILGTPRSVTPIAENRRSVLLPDSSAPTLLPPEVIPRVNTVFARDGATYFRYRATGPGSGQLVTVDTATSQESAASEPVSCAEPVTMSVAADVLVLSCAAGTTVFG